MNDRAQQQQQQQSRLSEKSLPGRLAAVIRRCLDAHLSVGAAPIFPTAALMTTTTTRATLLLDTGPHVELTAVAALATAAAAAAAALPSRFATFFDDGTINTPSGAVARRTTCAVLPPPRAVRTPTEKAESLDVVAQWDDVTRRRVVLASVRCALPVVMSLPSWLHCGNDQS